MTIITKPITDKKVDKLENPLVVNEELPDGIIKSDVETASDTEPHYFILKTRARRVSTATTICLFLTALLVMSIGIIGGVYLYRQLARSQIQRFRGWCAIPYDGNNSNMYMEEINNRNYYSGQYVSDSLLFPLTNKIFKSRVNDDTDSNIPNKMEGFFNEEFEVDIGNEEYEKIHVPEFRGARRGRFIHDFKANKTAIVDLDNGRCFVMPLDRQRVLPPRNMLDLIRKMWEGYYVVDTDVVRETMKVIIPPITDFNSVGYYISKECKNFPTYMLVKYTYSVVKRSVSAEAPVFAEFAGNKIQELNFENFDEVLEYEAQNLHKA